VVDREHVTVNKFSEINTARRIELAHRLMGEDARHAAGPRLREDILDVLGNHDLGFVLVGYER
jgi:hypothetical protein